MHGSAGIFFLLFALVLVIMYLAMRRRWADPGVIAGIGVLGSVITMTLVSLAQGNSVFQAALVGILVGGSFSGATLAISWYFLNSELNETYSETGYQPAAEMPLADDMHQQEEEQVMMS